MSGGTTAGANLSGVVTTTSGAFSLPMDAKRRPGDLLGQNVGSNNIGFNEFGGAAVIGAAGTWTVAPGQMFKITTNQKVNFVAADGDTPVTITRIA